MRTASVSSSKGITAATGPKISSRAARSVGATGERTVGEHDVGRLAAELERHALDGLRGKRSDALAYVGRTCERDLGDVRVLDEMLAHRPSSADDDIQDAFGDPGLQSKLLELQGGERRERRRLQHDRVAG